MSLSQRARASDRHGYRARRRVRPWVALQWYGEGNSPVYLQAKNKTAQKVKAGRSLYVIGFLSETLTNIQRHEAHCTSSYSYYAIKVFVCA